METFSIPTLHTRVDWNGCWVPIATWTWYRKAATRASWRIPWPGFVTMTGTKTSARLVDAAQRRAIRERPSVLPGYFRRHGAEPGWRADRRGRSASALIPAAISRLDRENYSGCDSGGVAKMPCVPGRLRGARDRHRAFADRSNVPATVTYRRVRSIIDFFRS